MTQIDGPTSSTGASPGAQGFAGTWVIMALKVAVVLLVCEFAVMCIMPVFGLDGMWESIVDGLLMGIIALPALYLLGFSPRKWTAIDKQRYVKLEGRIVVLLVANVVMIILVIAVYGLLMSGQESSARMINVAGRQRMLSQRLVKATMFEAMRFAHADVADREPDPSKTMAECSTQFERALRGLVEGDAELRLVPCPSREAKRQLELVDPVWQQLRGLSQRFSEPTDMNEAQAYFNSLQQAGDRVLVEMNRAVELLERHYESRARLLNAVLGPTIALSAGIGIFLMITIRQVTRHRQQLRAELLQTNEDLLAVNKVHQALFRARTESDVAKTITDALVSNFSAYFARVWLVEQGDLCSECANAKACETKMRCLHLVASSGHYTHIDGDHRRVPLGAFKIGLIAEGRGKTICNDVVNDERVHDREWAARHGLQSFAGFPLVQDGKVIGVMALFSRRELPMHLLNTLEILARLGASALTNVERIEALRTSEAEARKLSIAVEQSPASVVITDTRGTIEYVNPMFTKVTGYTSEEAIGRNSRILKSGKMPTAAYKAMWDKILSGEVWTGEFQNRKKNGELYWETASISPVRNAEGEVAHFVGVKLDITKAKDAEEVRLRQQELEQERNALRGAVKAQERLLGVVGHELRTPLAGIRAISELLLEEGAREMAEFDTFLANIHDESVRMSGLVNDLLEVARMRSGVANWNWSGVAVREVCEAAVSTIRPLIDQDKVEVTVKVDPPDLVMRGDNNGIRQLLVNLLSNAGKHTPEGSIHVLALGLEQDGQAFVKLTVSDTGLGMTPTVARRLGEAFALNSGVIGASCVKGSGLGLAICRGIVTAHGGTMTVKSAEGQGSVFTAVLRADLEGPMSTEQETRIECEVT